MLPVTNRRIYMKLKEWLDDLNDKVRLDPSILGLDIIYGTDDEGNYFKPVSYTACKGYYSDTEFKELSGEEDEIANVVCLN